MEIFMSMLQQELYNIGYYNIPEDIEFERIDDRICSQVVSNWNHQIK